MRLANIIAALITLGLGIFMVMEAGKMHTGFGGGLNPGVFPRLLGMGLILLSAIQVASELLPTFMSKGEVAWPRGKSGVQVMLVIASVIAYLLSMEYLGFTTSTFLLVLFLINLLSSFKWYLNFAAAVMTTGLSTLVFQYWLDLKLPGGFLGI